MSEPGKNPGISRNITNFILFVLLLASFSSSVWGDEQKDIDEKLERGRHLFEKGDLLNATTLFEEVIALKPSHKSARSMLFTCYRFIGMEYYGLSQYDEAIDTWRKALKLEPQNEEMQRFIKRCESEKHTIASITGNTSGTDEKQKPSKKSKKTNSDSSSRSQSGFRKQKGASTDERTIISGLFSGIVLGTGSSHSPRTGMTFMGYLSLSAARYRPGGRLEGIHSRFYQDSPDAATTPHHLAVSGLSISAVMSSQISRSTFIEYSVGPGFYEIILTESNDGQFSGNTRRSSSLGINLGLGFRKSLGAISATVDARYNHLFSSLSPNLLQIFIGIATN